MGEHGKFNKGKPYKTSAGVPFIIRYPKRIKKGKVVKTAYSSPDFTPTILSLLGITYGDATFQGIDGSDELLDNAQVNSREQVRFITNAKQANWIAAVDRDHKLILSGGPPVLFDLKKDPDELHNFHGNETYHDITEKLETALLVAAKEYKFPFTHTQTIFINRPVCFDSEDQISQLPYRVCDDLRKRKYKKNCKIDEVSKMCPDACGICCEDTKGVIGYEDSLITCNVVKFNRKMYCEDPKISKFCPVTCLICVPIPSSFPSKGPSSPPTMSHPPTAVPSISPSTSSIHNPTKIISWIPSKPPTVSSDSPSNYPTIEPSSILNKPTAVVTNEITYDSPPIDSSYMPTIEPSSSSSSIPVNSSSMFPSG